MKGFELNSKLVHYQICKRCVMDTSDPEITFDDDGNCNLCTEFFKNRLDLIKPERRGTNLTGLFEMVRKQGRGKKYDCVVGVSGGVDSSTVVRLAVEHGLRVLAVHMDNGWDSPIAVQNIKHLVDKLAIDYVSYVLPWEHFREIQVAFLKASVPEVETPTDIAIQRAVHHFAAKYGVTIILSGGNVASEGILPVSWHYNSRDLRYAYSILEEGGVSKKLFSEIRFGFFFELYHRMIKSIKTVYPLNYLSYDKDDARKKLERHYNWKYYGSKHGESRFTKFIQNYYLFVKHGIDYRRATTASELCSGKVDRDSAIARLEGLPYSEIDLDGEINYISKKLLLNRDEFESIILNPPKWYFDYPNNKKILGIAYDTYRLVYGKQKTSNF